MPLIKRSIEPAELSRTKVGPGVQNELECVTNNTLASVIRQLSSLSKQAEDMFSELYRDANSIFQRTVSLQERVDKLNVKVTQLDSTVEEVSLTDINMRKPFKSTVTKEQQVISIKTRPWSIQETYNKIDAPPALDKLNPYREDHKDSMKFYTDPTYFFELWCHEMQNQTEHQKRELKQRRKQRRPKQSRGPQTIRQPKTRQHEYEKMKHGKEFAPEMPRSATQQSYGSERSASRPSSLEINAQHLQQANGGQLPPGYQQYSHNSYQQQQQQGYANGPVQRSNSVEDRHSQAPPYQAPPSYNHPNYPQGHEQYNHCEDTQSQQSPYHSPGKRGTRSNTPGAVASPARPSQAPPPPPGVLQNARMDSDSSLSASRGSLPPPPPPPPLADGSRQTPPYSPATGTTPQHAIRDSPGLRREQTPSPQLSTAKSSTPESMDLPPPPPPPIAQQTPDTPGSMHSMPPPPPTPPLPDMVGGGAGPPAPPPPPPPGMGLPNGTAPQYMQDGRSYDSSQTESSGSTMKSEEAAPLKKEAPVPDARSDLLVAIRTGIQLKKVERQEKKKEALRKPHGGLDVQSIMEAAFEMRRRALEEGDSEEEEDEGEDMEWSDED